MRRSLTSTANSGESEAIIIDIIHGTGRIGNISRERMPLYTIHARTPYAFDKHLEGVWKSVKLLKQDRKHST